MGREESGIETGRRAFRDGQRDGDTDGLRWNGKQEVFPESHYIVSQMALARYNMRDFSEVVQLLATR